MNELPPGHVLTGRGVHIDVLTPYNFSDEPVMLRIQLPDPVDPRKIIVGHFELSPPGSEEARNVANHLRGVADHLDPGGGR